MAIIAAEKSNIDMNKILKVIPKLNQSRDGLKKLEKLKSIKVILDYAHTQCFKTCLLNLREQFLKIIALFGCGGNEIK